MTGITLRAAMSTVILSAWMLQSAEAQIWKSKNHKTGYARVVSARRTMFKRAAPNREVQPPAVVAVSKASTAVPHRAVKRTAAVPVRYRRQAPARFPHHVAARSVRHADLGQTAYAGRARRQPAPQPKHPAKGYPYLNASMYPSPLQNIPYQVGGAVYTNQAFAPHEMLHEHEYEALYGPFYHKVEGYWLVTPWGVWSSDTWKLAGTKVEVEYEPHISWFSGFVPPRVH